MVPLLILAVSLYPVRLGVIYALRPTLGADAIWISFPVAFVSTMLLAFAYHRWGNWRDTNLTRTASVVSPNGADPRGVLTPEPAHA